MVRQNERFRLPVSGQLCYLVQAWIDRFSRRPLALPAFSQSLAEQTELHRHHPSRLSITRRKAGTSTQNHARLASASRHPISRLLTKPAPLVYTEASMSYALLGMWC